MNERKWADLQKLSDDELIAEHDELAKSTVVGTQYHLDELRYRRQKRFASRIYCLTVVVAVLTAVVTATTVVNVVLIAIAQ